MNIEQQHNCRIAIEMFYKLEIKMHRNGEPIKQTQKKYGMEMELENRMLNIIELNVFYATVKWLYFLGGSDTRIVSSTTNTNIWAL